MTNRKCRRGAIQGCRQHERSHSRGGGVTVQLSPLASFSNYDELRRALNDIRNQRNISFETLNELTGAPAGYFQKLLGPRPIRRIGLQSFDWVFGGLGIKAVFVDDPKAWALIERHSSYKKRDEPHFRSAMHAEGKHHIVTWRFLKKISRAGGKARALKLTQAKRKKIARMAAKARWNRERAITKSITRSAVIVEEQSLSRSTRRRKPSCLIS
jgi:hypothetical protein